MEFGSIYPFVRFVRHLTFSPDTYLPSYCPMDARLFYVSSGKGRIHICGNDLTLDTGSVLFINAGVCYRLLPCDAVYLAVNFDFTWSHAAMESPIPPVNLSVSPPFPPLQHHTFPSVPCFDTYCIFSNLHSLQSKLTQLEQEYIRKLPYYRQETGAILHSVLNTLARQYELRPSKDHRFDVEQIVQYIRQHYSQPVDNRTLAAHFHFHPNYLSTEFKRSTGKPLHQYVLETRILAAVSMMESGNSSISQIAAQTGFSDPNYFTRYFKRVIGTTPGKYIRSCVQK